MSSTTNPSEKPARAVETVPPPCGTKHVIDTHKLPEGCTLVIRTRNSVYRATLIDPATGQCLLSGGTRFPNRVPARFNGSNNGGSALFMGAIGVGMFAEFDFEWRKPLTTSSVQSVDVEPPVEAEATR